MERKDFIQIRNFLIQNNSIKIGKKEYIATNYGGLYPTRIVELNKNTKMDFPQFLGEIKDLDYKTLITESENPTTYPSDFIDTPKEHPIKYTYSSNEMEFKFFGDGRFFGFELEVERLHLNHLTNEDLINIIGKNREWLYFTTDCSLINGFEIISHPCSIDFLQKHLPSLLEELQKLGLGGFKTAGLHFHVARSVFGNDTQTQLKTIGNLIKDVFNNYKEIKKVCGRVIDTKYTGNWKGLKNSSELLNIENPLFLGSEKKTDNSVYVRSILKKDYTTDRGFNEIRNKPINLLKKRQAKGNSTVEFRLPASTVNYNEFMERLLLYNSLIDKAIS